MRYVGVSISYYEMDTVKRKRRMFIMQQINELPLFGEISSLGGDII